MTSRRFIILATVAIVVIATGVMMVSIYAPTMYRASVVGYAQKVPVQFGYDEAGGYWLISATVNEKSAFRLSVDAGTTEDIGDDYRAKVGNSIDIVLNPLRPTSKTDMTAFKLDYVSKRGLFGYGYTYTQAPMYEINDAGWLTTASYEVEVFRNSYSLVEQTVNINYQESRTIQLSTLEGTVLIDNLGMLPQGVEVPSGDLVAVQDPNSAWHIFNKPDVVRMVSDWNIDVMTYGYPTQAYNWANVWQWAASKNILPKDVNMVHVEKFEFIGTMQNFKLTYAGMAFVGFITVMIPESMADIAIIRLYTPVPKITDIDPDELPAIEEGKATQLIVKIKNEGTEGTVGCVVTSSAYVASPLTPTSVTLKEGETYLFKFQMMALNVETDVSTDVSIRVEGRGGSDTASVVGSVKNVPGYTPPPPEPTPEPTPTPPVIPGWFDFFGNIAAWLSSPFNTFLLAFVLIIIIAMAFLFMYLLSFRWKAQAARIPSPAVTQFS